MQANLKQPEAVLRRVELTLKKIAASCALESKSETKE